MPELPGFQQWRVEPVKLTQTWMPRARFDHQAHKTTECTECHIGASMSKTSGDVLMPAIAQCRTCHTGASEKDKLPSDCLMCHQFHLPGRGLFDQSATSESQGSPRAGIIQRMREQQP